ncbi:hypothetical protein KHA80_19905 [Anaerobacillus sp. HL2]|nr:hypothetical protein KHA80_19905 [Anaerobacillus sp. HL2]
MNDEVSYPLLTKKASGINGIDAILKPIFPKTEVIQSKEDIFKVDLKQVINIPSVTHGQLIGENPAYSRYSWYERIWRTTST